MGPGEGAGIVDIGDNQAVVFKIESHNHPSAVEPYQGAATGVGGIIRDIFSMGARPVALLNSLRFGKLTNDRVKYLFENVVSGIAGYGNCIGIPTVGGEVMFDESYEAIRSSTRCVSVSLSMTKFKKAWPKASATRYSTWVRQQDATAFTGRRSLPRICLKSRNPSARPFKSAIRSWRSWCSKPALS